MNAKKRILEFINHIDVGQASFERKAGISNGYVNNLKGSIGSSIINKISAAYPELNIDWLLTGEGSMLKTALSVRDGVIVVTPDVIREGDYTGTLVYDIDAVCGTDSRNIAFTQEMIIGSVNLPGIKSTSHIITASGDSMQPRICNGDRIAIREIHDMRVLIYGQIYMIITEEYRLLKTVKRHKTDPNNMIVLASSNPDYDDIDLPKDQIIKLFIVENIISIKNVL